MREKRLFRGDVHVFHSGPSSILFLAFVGSHHELQIDPDVGQASGVDQER